MADPDPSERQALLLQDVSNNPSVNSSDESRAHSDGWWGTGSSYTSTSEDSSSSSSDSEPEWESEINARGELFFVTSYPKLAAAPPVEPPPAAEEIVGQKARSRHGARGKLVRLLRRGRGRQSTKFQAPKSKVTFQDSHEGDVRIVEVTVDPSAGHNLGRRATMCENLLGIQIAAFTDETRIMVTGGETLKQNRNIKVGDWMRKIDGQEVCLQSIDAVLSAIATPRKLVIQVQQVAGYEVHASHNVPGPSCLVDQLTGVAEVKVSSDSWTVGVLFLTLSDGEEVTYCYPSNVAAGALAESRGVFITLHHLFPEVAGAPPTCSSVLLQGQLTHVMYKACSTNSLLLLALPDMRCSANEAKYIAAGVVRFVEFNYQTLTSGFNKTNHASMDHFFALFFSRLLDAESTPRSRPVFEQVLPVACTVSLPRESQVQLDEALSELESNDFDHMVDDLKDYQRLYTIIGTCVYHQNVVLASHCQSSDLVDVNNLLRQQGLLHLLCHEPVRSMVIWRRVYPASCNRGLVDEARATPYQVPRGKWYILIVGKGHDMLVLLLESGGCTVRSAADSAVVPDPVYVEQAQETLEHIQKLGLTSLVSDWLAKSPRPQVRLSEEGARKVFTSPPEPAVAPSILKQHRASDTNNSETDSQSEYSGVLGRRAERAFEVSQRHSDSETDSEYYRSESRSFESPEKGIENIIPTKLTTGVDNVLFHFVQLDLADGVLVSTHVTDNQSSDQVVEVMNNFRSSAHVIHNILQKTVQYKKLSGADLLNSPINKALIAIKEHGVLFESKALNLSYWVIGRLFFTPQPREVFVCYEDTAPQNLVEIAFRLALNASG